MRAALYGLLLVATALAIALARVRREHRPVAYVLGAGVVINIARAILNAYVLPPPGPPIPAWLAVIDSSLWLGWPTILAALAIHTLARRPAWWAASGFVLALVLIAVENPRADDLRRVYTGVEIAAGLVAIGSLVSWRIRRESVNVTSLCAAALPIGHAVAVLAGPYRLGLFGQAWSTGWLAYVAILTTIIIIHVGAYPWSPEPSAPAQ